MTLPSEPTEAPEGRIRGYAICCMQRVGSNYLGALLSSTDLLGRPAEYFNKSSNPVKGLEEYPDDPELQMAYILSAGMTSNGVYGLKVFPDQFDKAIKTRWAEVLPRLRFIHLERDDILGQAISTVRARQSRQWSSGLSSKGVIRYDEKAIERALIVIVQGQARWRYWFGRTDINVLRLRYEQVMADPQGAVDAVANLVELDQRPTVRPESVSLAVQRDELSEQWRDQFVRANGGRSIFN